MNSYYSNINLNLILILQFYSNSSHYSINVLHNNTRFCDTSENLESVIAKQKTYKYLPHYRIYLFTTHKFYFNL